MTSVRLSTFRAVWAALALTAPVSLGGCIKPIRVDILREAPPRASTSNVILVTLDGVRWQEFFGERPDPVLTPPGRPLHRQFEGFWRELAPMLGSRSKQQ